MADTSIKISLELGAAAAQVALGDLASKAEQVDKHVQAVGEHGSGAFAEIALHIGKASGAYEIFEGNLAANLAIKGIELLTDAAKELFALLVTEGVHAAADQADAVNRLNFALAGGGEYTKKASAEFQEFAESLSNSTTVSKTAILQNGALLESLAQLSGEGLQKATKAAVELSAITGKDLETTTRALAKTANGSTTALKKLGISFEEGTTSAETFENVLKSITARGPAAEGAAGTYTGALKQQKNALEELQIVFGDSIVKNSAIIAGIRASTDSLKGFGDEAKNGTASLRTLAAEGFVSVVTGAAYIVTAFDSILRVADLMYQGIKVTFNLLGGALVEPFAYFSKTAKIALEHFNDEARLAADGVRNSLTKDTGLGEVATALVNIADKAKAELPNVANEAAKLKEPFNGAKKAVEALAESLTNAQKEAEKFVASLLAQADSIQGQYTRQSKALDDSLKLDQEKIKAAADKSVGDKVNSLKQLQALDKDAYGKKDALLAEEHTAELKRLDDFKGSDEEYLIAAAQADQNYLDKKKQADDAYTIAAIANNKKLEDAEKASKAEKIKAVGDTFSALASLSQSGNRELFEIGKQAAAASALINTFEAITKTMSFTPYPFNIPLAAAQGIAGAVQVSKIESQHFANGGIVGGSSFSGDNVTAKVNSGEMVLNGAQQAGLFALANGNGGGSGATALAAQVAQLGAAVAALANQPISVSIDGVAVFNATRNQIRAGRTLA